MNSKGNNSKMPLKASREFEMCRCGHKGGKSPYPFNKHLGLIGHGICEQKDCNCQKFTWVFDCDIYGEEIYE